MEEKKINEQFFFTFQLGKGTFAVPVVSVKEVLNYETVTPVPNSKRYLKGVINIRGAVVTVADFRILFGFEPVVPLEKNSIIITEIKQENEPLLVLGLIADSVDAVSLLQIIPAENVNYGSLPGRREFISCVAKKENQFVLVLDLEQILTAIKSDIDQPGANPGSFAVV
jgi:purine-binding chemotaxis protein CheW